MTMNIQYLSLTMRETVIIRSSLDITDPTYVLAAAEKNILNILKERFEKKCYRYPAGSDSPSNSKASLYIDEVIEIVSHTESQISTLGSSVDNNINNIEFRVSAIRCTQGEILNGCVIAQVVPQSNGIILMRQPCMHMLIPASEDAKAIGERKYISVVVDKVSHKYGKSIISIGGAPMLGFIKTPAYRINADFISGTTYVFLRDIYSEKFANEAEELSAIQEDKDDFDRRTRLRDHLYGCKDFNRRQEVPKGCKVISVNDLMDSSKIKSGWYFRYVARDMDSEDVFFTEDEKNIPAGIVKETRIGGQDAFSALMRHYYQGMVLLREWTFIYKGEIEKSHGNLWKILNKNKV